MSPKSPKRHFRHGLLSRNHLNILSSDVVVALPGSAGTLSEIQLAVRYGTAVIAYLEYSDQIPDLPSQVPVTDDLARVQEFVSEHAPIGS